MTFPKLTTDGSILFGTRVLRMFAYGFLSVVLVLYLAQLGLSEGLIGLLLESHAVRRRRDLAVDDDYR